MSTTTDPTTTDPTTTESIDIPDLVAEEHAREVDAEQFLRSLRGDEAGDEAGDGEASGDGEGDDDEAADDEAAGGDRKPKADDEEDELDALERRMLERQATAKAQADAAARAAKEVDDRIAAAREEASRVTRDELRSMLASDPLGVLDAIGLDAGTLYLTLREHAAGRSAPRSPAGPQAAAWKPQQAQAGALDAATVAQVVAAELDRRMGAPATARAQDGADGSYGAAAQAFADLSGDVDAYPLLSDLSAQERVRLGVLVAQRRVEEGRASESGDLGEVASEVEALLAKRHERASAKLAKVRAKAAGSGGDGSAVAGSDQRRRGKPATPQTITPDLAAERTRRQKVYPDGIEPDDERIEGAIAELRRLKR